LLNDALAAFVDATLLPRPDGSIVAELRPVPVKFPARMNILAQINRVLLEPRSNLEYHVYWFSA